MIERLRQLPRGLIAVLALSLTLNSIGAGWGLPNDRSWSNDDPTPKVPLRIGQIWCCGDNKYPYLQPLITRAVYAPSVAWWRHNGDIIEPCDDLGDADCFRRPYDQLGWLMRLSRLLAAAMGAGVVAAVYAMTRRLYADRRAALFAALAAAVVHELVLFSHWGNVDVPYLFWFAWSIVAFIDVVDRGRVRDYAAFGLLSSAALSTKESIVGAYVLVGVAILVVHARRALAARPPGQAATYALERSLTADPRLTVLLLCLFGLYGIVNNVVFNWAGFQAHVGHWIGGTGIDPWNDRFTGHAALLATFAARLRDAAGWPWLAAAGVGAAWATWRDRRTAWVLLPAVSYYLFTIAPIRYTYTRFTLPVAILLAVPVGWLAARVFADRRVWVRDAVDGGGGGSGRDIVDADPPGRRSGIAANVARSVLALTFLHALLYSIHADVMLLTDGRFAAERWLVAEVPREARVVVIGSSSYLPRLDWLGYEPERLDDDDASLAAVQAEDADVVVTTRRARAPGIGADPTLVDQLVAAGYAVRYDAASPAPLAPLLGTAYIESRVNPRTVILVRGDVAVPASSP